ncbi:hypothetical protein [Oscillibacter sp.]|uniref:hypothetical protein n=1 Tax=Oscillibacter sp. TaxID=1945593 RepID=UPI0028963FAB|nr:hypothetical protein [Oscillibacter sp.]
MAAVKYFDDLPDDSEEELFQRTADIIARMSYHGQPIHVRFTCPLCHGTAEIIRSSPMRGVARCMTCRIVMARGRIEE